MNGLVVAVGRFQKQPHGFHFAVGFLSAIRLGAVHILHIDRHFDLQHIHAIAVLAELLHAGGNNLGLFLGVVQALFVGALFVAHEFEEERNVIGAAFVADPLDPCMLLVIDVLGIEGRVVKQDLQAVRARFLQAAHRPQIQQVAQAPRAGLVISCLLVSQQQPRILGAPLGRRQPPLRIEQDGAGVRREHLRDQRS